MRSALEWPLPDILRQKIEATMKQRLPKDVTISDGLTLSEFLEAFGCGIGVKLKYLQEIRRACDALATLPAERLLELLLSEGGAQPGDDPKSLKARALAHLLEVAMERRKIFDMEMPNLQEMEKEAADEVAKEMKAAQNKEH